MNTTWILWYYVIKTEKWNARSTIITWVNNILKDSWDLKLFKIRTCFHISKTWMIQPLAITEVLCINIASSHHNPEPWIIKINIQTNFKLHPYAVRKIAEMQSQYSVWDIPREVIIRICSNCQLFYAFLYEVEMHRESKAWERGQDKIEFDF